jgi:O-antigen/teichoic acid export membrane protein
MNDKPEPRDSASASLGDSVTRSTLWTMAGGLATKAITLIGQLVLAWLLIPEDFGVAAMALSFASFAAVFSSASLKAVLVQRQREFYDLASDVVWLGFALHSMAAAAIFLAAPIAGRWFEDVRVVPLIRIVAVGLPLTAIPMANWAKLQIDMRFKAIAGIQLGKAALETSSILALAATGFGALSFVLPRLWVPIYEIIFARIFAGSIQLRLPNSRVILSLIAPALWFTMYSFSQALSTHSVTFVVGVLKDAIVVGFCFWGLQVAMQSVFVLSANLRHVLFPAFARIQSEDDRNREAYCRAIEISTAIAIPLCCAQAVVARPLIVGVFADKWLRAVPVVEWLSFGMWLVPANMVAIALMLSKGRFRALSTVSFCQLILLAVSTMLGALYGQEKAIAVSVAFGTVVGHFIMAVWAARLVSLRIGELLSSLRSSVSAVFPVWIVGVVTVVSSWNSGGLVFRGSVVLLMAVLWLRFAPRSSATLDHFIRYTLIPLVFPRRVEEFSIVRNGTVKLEK